MDEPLLIISIFTAIISAFASVAISILTWKQSSAINQELNQLKIKEHCVIELFEIYKNNLEKRITALDHIIATIQNLKDNTREFLKNLENIPNDDIILKTLQSVDIIKDEFVQEYAQCHPYLSDQERNFIHDIKILSILLVKEIHELNTDSNRQAEIKSKIENILIKYEKQQKQVLVLRESLINSLRDQNVQIN